MSDAGLLELPMPRKPKAAEDDQTPTSETVRVAGDLMEMLREICFNSRDSRKRRPKIAAVVDELLRPAVVKRHREVMQRKAQAARA
jgi:hypothetical protein